MKYKKTIINKLNDGDIEKLNLIYLNSNVDVSFELWFEKEVIKRTSIKIISIVFLFHYIILVFFMSINGINAFLALLITYSIPLFMLTIFDSYISRIPLFFYMKIKFKMLMKSMFF